MYRRRYYNDGAAEVFGWFCIIVFFVTIVATVIYLFQSCNSEPEEFPQYYIVMNAKTFNESEERTRREGAYRHKYTYEYTVLRAQFLRVDGSGDTVEWTKSNPGRNSINYNLSFGDLVVVDQWKQICKVGTLAQWINLQKGEG